MEGETGTLPEPAVQRDLVVIGASAGGVDVLQEFVAGLSPEFPAAILVVLHVPATGTSVLPQILSRRGPLPAVFATDGVRPERGQIYVAPADHHMLLRNGRINLTQGPRENGHRPAIDPLFRSAARMAGPRCVGVVISGMLDDGASGLRFIKQWGGSAVVQDPDDAAFPSMPRAALAMTDVDAIAPASELAQVLSALIDATIPSATPTDLPAGLLTEATVNGRDRVDLNDPTDTAKLVEGPPAPLTCPECGGTIWEQVDGEHVRYACHVGHAYTLPTLAEEQGRALETTLWSAVRSLEERADVYRRLGRRMSGGGGDSYEDRALEAEAHARTLRALLGAGGRVHSTLSDEP